MQAEPVSAHGISCIRIADAGTCALVALHGAHVLSWSPSDGRERLFLSERSRFGDGAAIRGGIPIVFPQFGTRGPLRRHGFARLRDWRFEGVDADQAVFALTGDAGGSEWPHAFGARVRVYLDAARLAVTLEIENRGDAPFSFTAALHTYLRVSDLAATRLHGLQGGVFQDNLDNNEEFRDRKAAVAFDAEVDRVYQNAIAPVTLVDGERRLRITQTGFADVVAWNPGPAARLDDLAPGDERRFVCVEAAQVMEPVQLVPAQSWQGVQLLEA
ncbi:MAG: D-hexose-6-phosphate mutarotase [Proteobacteria bacterium]|nr:D-hexose-6-phosphate mutarotase [Pseudomonadota bacterium]